MKTTWLRNPNFWFIFAIILVSIGLSYWLVSRLAIAEQNEVDVVTIVGTVLTVAALIFAIREQYKLRRTSAAIALNTQDLQNKVVAKTFDQHIDKCLKYISSIQENVNHDKLLLRVHVRLVDLKECLIELKKAISLKDNNPTLIDRINVITESITGYCTQIQVAGFEPGAIKDKTNFVSDINKIQNFFYEIKDSHILIS